MAFTETQSMSQPLVSVVTPVYNTEKYLAECIESVLAQSYQHWEYVIINNCSTDRSLEIAQAYARQDSRIKIHNNAQFLTQMQNWNHAMRQISPDSRYCKVVHADDWLFPHCLEQMVELAEEQPSVGIIGAYRLDETEVNLDGLPYPSGFVPGREVCRFVLNSGRYIFGSPTSLLIRSDLVRQKEKFYNEAYIHADKEICFELLQQVDFGFVHQVLTYTRRHNEATSTMTRRFETYKLSVLHTLVNYGPIFLNQEEYRQCLARELKRYYKFLARRVFELKDREFWDYHQKELKAMGLPLDRLRLTKAVLLQSSNVTTSLGAIRQSLRRKRSSSGGQPISAAKFRDVAHE